MTKFNNLKVKRVKSNLKYTESKLVKKRPHQNEEILKKKLSYRYHAEKGITAKGITLKGNTQRGITQKANTQKGITQKGITQKGITQRANTQKGITQRGNTQKRQHSSHDWEVKPNFSRPLYGSLRSKRLEVVGERENGSA